MHDQSSVDNRKEAVNFGKWCEQALEPIQSFNSRSDSSDSSGVGCELLRSPAR